MTANNKDRCVVLLHSLTQDTSSITFHNLDCHIFNLKKIRNSRNDCTNSYNEYKQVNAKASYQ